jgi:hypothetical protein
MTTSKSGQDIELALLDDKSDSELQFDHSPTNESPNKAGPYRRAKQEPADLVQEIIT